MNTTFGPVLGLAAAGLVLVSLGWFYVRANAPLDRRLVLAVGIGMAAFAAQALIVNTGAFLILQLATYAAMFGLVWLGANVRRTPASRP
jgi:hypothetical protein